MNTAIAPQLSELVPYRWGHETVLIVASGPSLRVEDVEMCRGKMRCIVINDNWKVAPWADVLYACDYRWWALNEGVPWFTGEKWTQDKRVKPQFPDVHWVSGKNNEPGMSFRPECIHNGRNSGYQALNLAILFGATRILLTGYDMQKTDGKSHWFGDHAQGLVQTADYRNFCAAYETIPPCLKDRGVEILNCTRETALTCFPRMTMEQALAN